MNRDYNREPEIWNDEEGDMAWVDVTAKTPDFDSALAFLIAHGHEQLDMFDDLLYENPKAEIDSASIFGRGMDVILHAPVTTIPDQLPVGFMIEAGDITATWRFDISSAAVKQEQAA